MTHPVRVALVGSIVLSILAVAGCHSSVVTSAPSVTVSTTTPTATPTKALGPNQASALAAVTGYYSWWNQARKNPTDSRLLELPQYVDIDAPVYAATGGDVGGLGTLGYHQVGNMELLDTSLDAENPSKITVRVCLDRTKTSLVNSLGATVDPRDRQTGATIPAAQVFNRSLYTLVTKPVVRANNGWRITELTGGKSSC